MWGPGFTIILRSLLILHLHAQSPLFDVQNATLLYHLHFILACSKSVTIFNIFLSFVLTEKKYYGIPRLALLVWVVDAGVVWLFLPLSTNHSITNHVEMSPDKLQFFLFSVATTNAEWCCGHIWGRGGRYELHTDVFRRSHVSPEWELVSTVSPL